MSNWLWILLGLVFLAAGAWLLLEQLRQAREVEAEIVEPAAPRGALSRVEAPGALAPPDVFDQQRILADLVELADQPLLVKQYVTRLRKRFTTGNQVALLNNWQSLYESATSTIEAKTKLRRAQSEYQQLEAEDDIKRKEKEVRLAELDAQEKEALLRRDQAERQRVDLRGDSFGKSEYERQMDAAWDKEKVNLLWEIRNHQGKQLASFQALSQWYNAELAAVNRNPKLTPDQRLELIQELNGLYEEGKEQIRHRQLGQLDGSIPEENIFSN